MVVQGRGPVERVGCVHSKDIGRVDVDWRWSCQSKDIRYAESAPTGRCSRPGAINADDPPWEQTVWVGVGDVGDVPENIFYTSESRGGGSYEVERRAHPHDGGDDGGDGRGPGRWEGGEGRASGKVCGEFVGAFSAEQSDNPTPQQTSVRPSKYFFI
jgi:hypothetical protein